MTKVFKTIENIICASILFWVTYKIVYKQVTMGQATDYLLHMEVAKKLFIEQVEGFVHPLWHVLVWSFYQICHVFVSMTYEVASSIITGIIVVAVFEVSCFYLKKSGIRNCEIIAFIACIVAPLYIASFNEQLYLGQGSPNTWHNPTNMLSRVFATIAFFVIVSRIESIESTHGCFDNERLNNTESNTRTSVMLAISLLLGVLAKPSFFQGFVPTLGIFIVVRLIVDRFKTLKQYFLLCMLFVPAAIVVVIQFFAAFIAESNTSDSGVALGWLKVMGIYTPNVCISTLLTVAFPLCFLILFYRSEIKKTKVLLSWLFVIVSWFEYAIIYETGSRMYNANFSWALNLSYSIVWLVSLMDFAKVIQSDSEKKTFDCLKYAFLIGLVVLHFISGSYYIYHLITAEGVWY